MTGGRWRRIVLGHVLAEHVVVVEEVVRVSGQLAGDEVARGSFAFGSGRTAGYAIGFVGKLLCSTGAKGHEGNAI